MKKNGAFWNTRNKINILSHAKFTQDSHTKFCETCMTFFARKFSLFCESFNMHVFFENVFFYWTFSCLRHFKQRKLTMFFLEWLTSTWRNGCRTLSKRYSFSIGARPETADEDLKTLTVFFQNEKCQPKTWKSLIASE